MNNPLFVVIDSPDGCGKSSLIKNVLDTWDIETNGPIKSFYDPGVEPNNPMNVIRSLVKNHPLQPETEVLLFQACRLELVTEIKNTLDMGINVICDRFDISTKVYQGIKGQSDLVEIMDTIFDLHKPDYKIVLNAPFDVITERLHKRFTTDNPNTDKFKTNDIFRMRVWKEYNNIIKDDSSIIELDASGTEKDVLDGFYNIIGHND